MTVLAATFGLALGLTFLAGCEDQASGEDAQLTSVLDELEQIERGYALEGEEDVSWPNYRQESYEQLVQDLEQIAQTGSQQEQVAAHRLLGRLHSSAALQITREARQNFAPVSSRATSLLTYLAAVERAASRIDLFAEDQGLRIEQLQEEIRESEQRHEQFQQEIAELQAELAELEEEHQGYRQQADEAYSQAQELRNEAFVAEGDAQYDLEEQADQVEVEANRYDGQAERVQAQIDVLEAQLQTLQRQSQTLVDLIHEMEQQIDQTHSRADQRTQHRAQAEEELVEAVDALLSEFNQLEQAYRGSVLEPFERGRQRMEQAVESLERASEMASGVDVESVEVELLGQRMERIRLYSDFASTVAGFAQPARVSLQGIQDIAPEQAPALEQAYNEFAEFQSRLLAQASDALAEADDLAADLAERGGDVGEYAERQFNQLDRFERTLQNLQLP